MGSGAAEEDEFDVVLAGAGDRKSTSRQFALLQDLAKKPRLLLMKRRHPSRSATKDEAEDFKKQLEEAGATRAEIVISFLVSREGSASLFM